ncbi:von Willebrand factor C domain-containing protein 2-like [Pecten maximus]|uniref:von Willebrand factor C domain-containing protein 2-like n=1 Tax=Pecten maximus TaxID=6579 RepID=UPI00145808ED|nr:von Willebrand factor C domain-containing protein 2-like [Pecten maximus]
MDIVILVLGLTVVGINSAHVLDNRITNSTLITTPRPTCWWNGTEYNHGDHFPRDKSCPTHASCECRSGQVSCVYPDCPAEYIACVDPVTPPCGCAHCPNGPNCGYGNLTIPLDGDYKVDENTTCNCLGAAGGPATCKIKGTCEYMGKLHSSEVFRPNDCDWCRCDLVTGNVNCFGWECMSQPISCVDAVVHNCCPKCPNGPNCRLGNKIIPANQDYNDGYRICRCPLLPSHDMHFGNGGPEAICEFD